MDKVQKYNSFNTNNRPSSGSYRSWGSCNMKPRIQCLKRQLPGWLRCFAAWPEGRHSKDAKTKQATVRLHLEQSGLLRTHEDGWIKGTNRYSRFFRPQISSDRQSQGDRCLENQFTPHYLWMTGGGLCPSSAWNRGQHPTERDRPCDVQKFILWN
jgi:hypothetical protein